MLLLNTHRDTEQETINAPSSATAGSDWASADVTGNINLWMKNFHNMKVPKKTVSVHDRIKELQTA